MEIKQITKRLRIFKTLLHKEEAAIETSKTPPPVINFIPSTVSYIVLNVRLPMKFSQIASIPSRSRLRQTS
jgi:hypothetical protein